MAGTLQVGQSPNNATVNIQPGMYMQPVVLADSSGNLAVFNANGQQQVAPLAPSTPLVYPTGSQLAADTGDSFSMTDATSIAVDITFTSFTGGTSPGITFFVQRLGASSIWYTVWSNTTPVTTAATISASIGPGQSGGTATSGIGGFSAVLSGTCRFGWSTTGSPTSWSGSAQVTVR